MPQPRDEHKSDPRLERPSVAPSDALVVELDISWLVPCSVVGVEALARLQVAASRCGCVLRLRGADGGLPELVDFVGLGDVLRLRPPRVTG